MNTYKVTRIGRPEFILNDEGDYQRVNELISACSHDDAWDMVPDPGSVSRIRLYRLNK